MTSKKITYLDGEVKSRLLEGFLTSNKEICYLIQDMQDEIELKKITLS